MTQEECTKAIAKEILSRKGAKPFLVAIDGVDASGKTTLAERLAAFLSAEGADAVRASIDGFHNPAEKRYARGKNSPEGFYRDSFDYEALKQKLLDPIAGNTSNVFYTCHFDFKTESVIDAEPVMVRNSMILVMDGVFMQIPALRGYWDFVIYVKAEFETTIKRAVNRDGYLFGSADSIRQKYDSRFVPGQKLYLAECEPEKHADAVIDNDDWDNPVLRFNQKA